MDVFSLAKPCRFEFLLVGKSEPIRWIRRENAFYPNSGRCSSGLVKLVDMKPAMWSAGALNWVSSPIVSNTDKTTDEAVIISDRVWNLSDTV